MITSSRCLTAIGLLLCLASPAWADSEDAPRVAEPDDSRKIEERFEILPQESEFERTVAICIEVVRRAMGAFSRFDAYVVEHEVDMVGTKEEFFKFGKCMAKRGHTLTDFLL